ncbi:MAG TPA: ABC transporter permease [Planctomycetota bacterium]|nr:ABC transporter permease [Planctomycetota bacterium]
MAELSEILPDDAPAQAAEPEFRPKGYWDLVLVQFRKNKIAVVSLYTIAVLFLVAAWAPVLANGKPFLWRKDGVTTYPLLHDLAAPENGIDCVFNYLLFSTILVPIALIGRWLWNRKAPHKIAAWKFVIPALVLALVPFFTVKWHEDALHYPELAASLDASKGDTSIFTVYRRDPISPRPADALSEPTRKNWLGTDKDGRDVLARMVHGSRISLSVGFVSESIAVLLGIFFGALAGFYRGWVDIAISRFIETVICFPTFFLILVIVAYFETRSIFLIMVVIGATGWPGIARLVRGEFFRLSEQDFVTAARALGSSSGRVMFRHMLPNAMGPVLVSAAFGVAGAILTESGLSYLGFGAPPPTPTWGEMISEGKENLEAAWWLIAYPGVAIFLTVTIYNLAGDGLRDAMDPKMRK